MKNKTLARYHNWTKYLCSYYEIHKSYCEQLTRQLSPQIEALIDLAVPWHRCGLLQNPVGDISVNTVVKNEYRTVFFKTDLVINARNSFPLVFYFYLNGQEDFCDFRKPLEDHQDLEVVLQEFKGLEKVKDFISNNTFIDKDGKYFCDTYFDVTILKNSLGRENYVIFYLDNFDELETIKNCISDVEERWNNLNNQDFPINSSNRGAFDNFTLKQTISSKMIGLYMLEFGWADELILKYFFESIADKTNTIKKVDITPYSDNKILNL